MDRDELQAVLKDLQGEIRQLQDQLDTMRAERHQLIAGLAEALERNDNRVAVGDYIVLHPVSSSSFSLANWATLQPTQPSRTFSFQLDEGALSATWLQRPYVSFEVSFPGGVPPTLTIRCNGTAFVSEVAMPGQDKVWTVPFGFDLLVPGSNTIEFEASGTQFSISLADIVVHHQRWTLDGDALAAAVRELS